LKFHSVSNRAPDGAGPEFETISMSGYFALIASRNSGKFASNVVVFSSLPRPIILRPNGCGWPSAARLAPHSVSVPPLANSIRSTVSSTHRSIRAGSCISGIVEPQPFAPTETTGSGWAPRSSASSRYSR
jgi:hypothetical protein